MAKRSRGAARPGQRPTTRRPQPQRPVGRATTTDAARPAARPVADDLDTELNGVEELAPPGLPRKGRDRAETAAAARVGRAQASSLLTARAAEEYAYVAKDVRHIAVVGGGLLIVLFVLWILIEVVRVIPGAAS